MYSFHLILALCQIYLTKSSSLVAPSRLLVTRIGSCFGTSLPVSISEMSLARKEFSFTTSGEMNISVDVPNGWSIKATMQKCHDIRNLDTCDHYKSLTVIRSGCEDVDEDDRSLQDKFFQYVTPRLGCPVKAGVYQISNYPFLTEGSDLTTAESKISTSVFGYTYRLDGHDKEYRKILCVDAYLQLIYVRKHDWIGHHKFKPIQVPARNNTANDTVDSEHENNDDAEVKSNDSKYDKNDADDEEQDNKDVNHNDDIADDNHSDGAVVSRRDEAEVKTGDTEQEKNNAEDVNRDDENKDTENDEDVKHDDDAALNKHGDDSVDDTADIKDSNEAEGPDQRRNEDNDQEIENDE